MLPRLSLLNNFPNSCMNIIKNVMVSEGMQKSLNYLQSDIFYYLLLARRDADWLAGRHHDWIKREMERDGKARADAEGALCSLGMRRGLPLWSSLCCVSLRRWQKKKRVKQVAAAAVGHARCCAFGVNCEKAALVTGWPPASVPQPFWEIRAGKERGTPSVWHHTSAVKWGSELRGCCVSVRWAGVACLSRCIWKKRLACELLEVNGSAAENHPFIVRGPCWVSFSS